MPGEHRGDRQREHLRAGSIFLSLAGIFAVVLFFFTLDQPRVVADNVVTSVRISICGNAVTDSDEVCDNGTVNNTGGYGSSTAERKCNSDCQSYDAYCGDSTLQVRFSEACDDGNNTSGDLCTSACQSETAVPQNPVGAPPRGGVPENPTGVPGLIDSALQTKVVLRGKAYPLSKVTILLDGKLLGTALADTNADFLFSANNVTPGTATFSFSAQDSKGINSLLTSTVFEVVQAAVTTVANVFLPPTISVNKNPVAPGELLTLSGQTVPNGTVVTGINPDTKATFDSPSDGAGIWALQVDTKSFTKGIHAAKSYFRLTDTVKSGYGKAITFNIGTEPLSGDVSPDLNGDGKVNLIDFSIFLISWQSDNPRTDFSKDGLTNLADFSIMLFAWTG